MVQANLWERALQRRCRTREPIYHGSATSAQSVVVSNSGQSGSEHYFSFRTPLFFLNGALFLKGGFNFFHQSFLKIRVFFHRFAGCIPTLPKLGSIQRQP